MGSDIPSTVAHTSDVVVVTGGRVDGTISPSDVVLVTPGVVEAGAVVGGGAVVVSTAIEMQSLHVQKRCPLGKGQRSLSGYEI